jgi:hypothetical protein
MQQVSGLQSTFQSGESNVNSAQTNRYFPGVISKTTSAFFVAQDKYRKSL